MASFSPALLLLKLHVDKRSSLQCIVGNQEYYTILHSPLLYFYKSTRPDLLQTNEKFIRIFMRGEISEIPHNVL